MNPPAATKPVMHCQQELEKDLGYAGVLPDATLFRWFNDRYSASKHLLTLYSVARGLDAKNILEIGFGRSSFVLAKAAHENGGRLTACDMRDFSYLLSSAERAVTDFVVGMSGDAFARVRGGLDFAFLDYFSDAAIPASFVESEIRRCLSLMKTNGVIAIHDSVCATYHIHTALDRLIRSGSGIFSGIRYEVLSLPYNYGLGLIRRRDASPHGLIEDLQLKKED